MGLPGHQAHSVKLTWAFRPSHLRLLSSREAKLQTNRTSEAACLRTSLARLARSARPRSRPSLGLGVVTSQHFCTYCFCLCVSAPPLARPIARRCGCPRVSEFGLVARRSSQLRARSRTALESPVSTRETESSTARRGATVPCAARVTRRRRVSRRRLVSRVGGLKRGVQLSCKV